ncbi:MAG: hypothetical protein LBL46_03130 [Rickettsiales bacterium]|jgi:hypothetical protein|nr:hypothetical protein [Rickettsiales bacterium]
MQKDMTLLKSIAETIVSTGGVAALTIFALYKIEMSGWNKFLKKVGQNKAGR